MSEEKRTFYKTLNNIVATNRIDNEEAYIINNYVSGLDNIIKEAREYIADRVAPDVNDYNIEFRLKLNTTVDEFIRHLSEILDKENK